MFARAAVLVVIAAALSGHQAPPSSDARTPQGRGTASIAGSVMAEAGGAPLARARVIIRSAAMAAPRVVLTDSSGAFRFESLPAGDYEIHVARTGYVLPHGIDRSPLRVEARLADGEARTGIVIPLARAGTIPGRLMDEDGAPLGGAEVQARSLRTASGQALTVTASATTDDRGDFRLAGLPAGQYFVVAIDPAFKGAGDPAGAVRYAPTFYPDALSHGDAQPISVVAGGEAPRVEFRIRIARPARVSGTIASLDRRPLRSGSVVMIPRDGPATASIPAADVDLLPDGRFSIRNVPPGDYQLRVRAEVDPAQAMWFASFAITVEGRDVDDIRMILSPGALVQGVLEWDPPTGGKSAASDRTAGNYPETAVGSRTPAGGQQPAGERPAIRVRAPLADGTTFGDSLTGVVEADGTFRIRGVAAGLHYFDVEGVPAPWTVTGVFLRGRSVLDQPVEIREGEQFGGLRIVVSQSSAELRGTVRHAGGAPARDALVVTSSAPPLTPSPVNPRFRTTRTDREGRFRIERLPPGDYRVTAVVGLDELVVRRREWLERLTPRGATVAVGANGVQTVDLVAIEPR
jgi:hypothetical protein